MTDELIEMTETVVDVHGFELRPGDRISLLVGEEDAQGVIFHITRPMGRMIQTVQGATTEQPPKVTVLLDGGQYVEFEPEFMRLTMWRWNVLALRRD
jgi:hypothetical protein